MNNKKIEWTTVINQSINLIYTAIFFLPLILLWFKFYSTYLMIVFISIALCIFFLPVEFYSFFQLSNSRIIYERFYIHKFQRFAQQGKYAKLLIERLTGKDYVIFKRHNISQLRNQFRTFEAYHWACLFLFSASIVYALINHAYLLTVLIFVSNLCYNIIPILIQQYNKVRLKNMGI